MSSLELPISGDRAGAGDNVQEDGNHIKTASLKMLEIADKLESLNQQLHTLEVDNKVLHYAHECGPDLNAFLSGRGSSRPSSPSKRRSNFLIPSVAGTSKGVSARKTFINLSPAQQFEALHQVAKEQSDVVLNFEGLRKAILASQMSNSLKKAVGLNKSTNEQMSPTETTPTAKEKDLEEVAFIKDILEEQNDLNEKIMAVEKERLEAMSSLLYSKIEVAKEFAETKQIYKDMISTQEIENEDLEEDMQKDGNDENSDNSNVTVGDEDAKLSRKVEKRKKKLQHEEDRLNQMRFLVQKVMASCPNNAMTFDEETNKLHYNMFIKLGQDISKLRGDVDA